MAARGKRAGMTDATRKWKDRENRLGQGRGRGRYQGTRKGAGQMKGKRHPDQIAS